MVHVKSGEVSTRVVAIWNSGCSRLGAMYCPQCKAEYRQGFTRCADCDVELVHELPTGAQGWGATGESSSHAEDAEDPFCSFWRGDDPRIHAELCELLNEEGIPHRTLRREDHLFNLNTKSGFEIGIPFSQFEKAETAVKDAYGTEEGNEDPARLLPFSENYTWSHERVFPWKPLAKGYVTRLLSGSEATEKEDVPDVKEQHADLESEKIRRGWDPSGWSPEEATQQVWSGVESYSGEIIEMALRENQIHARFDKAEGKNAIFVLPEDEARAREIVREVVEGAPPE